MFLNTSRLRAKVILVYVVSILGGCALPVPIGSELNGFVPPRELQIVSLAREGMALFNSSRFFEAEGKFRKALYLDPTLDNVRFNLAATLERTELYAEAEEVYLNLIKKDGEKAIYRAAYGRLLVSKGLPEAGKRQFARARVLAELEEDLPIISTLSQSLRTLEFSLGQIDEAICEAKALTLANKSIQSLGQYIRLLLSSGRIDQASRVLDTVGPEVILDDAVPSLYLRTLILNASQARQEALELSERVLATPALDPAIDFELRTINLISRYQDSEPELFEKKEYLEFLRILDDSLKASSLTSLYWSPQLLMGVQEMLADPELRLLLEE